MMRSMFSGVSGLRTHQTKMDVIAHNISNVNTVGFKSSRVTFAETFSQTVQGASRANEATGRGGTNPMQIGLGVNVASIDKNMGTGAAQRTDRALDVMINGDGFFIVSDNSGTYFTRAGAFDVDADGWVHMAGMRVNGWPARDNGYGEMNIERGPVEALRLGPDVQSIGATATSRIEAEGNLNPSAIVAAGGEQVSSISFFDTIGNRWQIPITFIAPTGTATDWTVEFGGYAFLNGRNDDDTNVAITGLADRTVSFDEGGRFDTVTPTTGLDFSTGNFPFGAVGPDNVTIDFSALTQFAQTPTSAQFVSNGNRAGTLEGISIGSDGIITGRYSNGDMQSLGQVAIANFRNPAGLEAVGRNLFVATPNSGDFNGIGEETGNMMGGVLEMSNVDLSAEFTEMITTQRGFQASSRLISTSDEMLQELVNLRR